MQFSLALTAAILAATGMAQDQSRDFVQVELADPQNWIAGPSLFPGDVIAGYHADMDQYDTDSWAEYVLEKCKGQNACDSTSSYSAINSGSPAIRYWFGYTYRGGATTPANYVRSGGVENSTVYSVSS